MQLSSLDGKKFDVIVCGAGSAGCAAAYGAARAGAKTLLLERLGFCGGTPVAAGIHTLDGLFSCRDHSRPVVAGYAAELVEELTAISGLATADNPQEAFSIHPELMKVAIDRVLVRTGIRIVYHAVVVDALYDAHTIRGVEVALLDGRARLAGKAVVDATGDAAVAFFAGSDLAFAPELQPMTYHFRLGNVKPGATWEQLESACRDAMREEAPSGFQYGGPWVIRLLDGELSINATRVCANPIDPEQRSGAEREAREDMLSIFHILRRRVPHLADSYIVTGATDLHVRESRKILGEYVFTEQDIEAGRRFNDSIAVGAWPLDIHPSNGSVGVHPHKENPPEPYEIPYGCLLPRHVDGLLVAGRPISTTHIAHGSTRVPGTSMATGQAAGVAAALASRYGITPRSVDVEELRRLLLEQGAILCGQPPVTK